MHTTSTKTEIKVTIKIIMSDNASQSEFYDNISSLCSSNQQ